MGTNYHQPQSIESRFWQKVANRGPDACWGWAGAKNEHGYGVIGRGGRGEGNEKAHRVSWTIHNGPIPTGQVVCHKCDNPECTNPNHLFLGTMKDNNADMMAKGRHVHGECSYSKLTQDQVEEIRRRYNPRIVSQYILAREYGVSRSAIGKIVNRESWGNV